MSRSNQDKDPRKYAVAETTLRVIRLHEKIKDQLREVLREMIGDLQLPAAYLVFPDYFLDYDAMISETSRIDGDIAMKLIREGVIEKREAFNKTYYCITSSN